MVISEDLAAFVNQFLLLLIPFTAYIKILQACQGDAHTLFLICNCTLVIFNWCRTRFLLKGKYKRRQYLQNQTLSQSQLLAAAWHFFPPLRSICRWEWLLHYRLSCANKLVRAAELAHGAAITSCSCTLRAVSVGVQGVKAFVVCKAASPWRCSADISHAGKELFNKSEGVWDTLLWYKSWKMCFLLSSC